MKFGLVNVLFNCPIRQVGIKGNKSPEALKSLGYAVVRVLSVNNFKLVYGTQVTIKECEPLVT